MKIFQSVALITAASLHATKAQTLATAAPTASPSCLDTFDDMRSACNNQKSLCTTEAKSAKNPADLTNSMLQNAIKSCNQQGNECNSIASNQYISCLATGQNTTQPTDAPTADSNMNTKASIDSVALTFFSLGLLGAIIKLGEYLYHRGTQNDEVTSGASTRHPPSNSVVYNRSATPTTAPFNPSRLAFTGNDPARGHRPTFPAYKDLPIVPNDAPDPSNDIDPISLESYEEIMQEPAINKPVRIAYTDASNTIHFPAQVLSYQSVKTLVTAAYRQNKNPQYPTTRQTFGPKDIFRESTHQTKVRPTSELTLPMGNQHKSLAKESEVEMIAAQEIQV